MERRRHRIVFESGHALSVRRLAIIVSLLLACGDRSHPDAAVDARALDAVDTPEGLDAFIDPADVDAVEASVDARCAAPADGSTVAHSIVESEAAWIAASQIPAGHGSASGAIPIHPDASNGQWWVVPYFSNFGALGLLAEGCRFADNVRAWMTWYLGHLEAPDYNHVDGTVYDWHVDSTTFAESLAPNPSPPHQTPWYDSTDSYAATFVSVVRGYTEITGDTAFAQTHRAAIERVIGAMEATRQPDGLTWAKPDYLEKYLMDNAEVYRGTLDAAWLYANVYDDSTQASRFTQRASLASNTIAAVLWQPSAGLYAVSRHGDGTVSAPSWGTWYPDATAQTWVLWEGLLDPSSASAQSLWDRFNAAAPRWTTTVNNPDGMPWATIGLAAVAMHDATRASTFLASVQTHWIAAGHPWPWTVQEAGAAARTARAVESW